MLGKRKRITVHDVTDGALVQVPRHYHDSDSDSEPPYSLTEHIHSFVSGIIASVVRSFRRSIFSQRRRLR